jgi:poly[(R)-3-hydroxyalkanoate] polymerase subunit PhaC
MTQPLPEPAAGSTDTSASQTTRALVPVRSAPSDKVTRRDVVQHPASRPHYALPAERDSYTASALQEIYNRSFHAAMSRFTKGLSPAALAQARQDWLLHLASAPGKQMSLFEKAARKWLRFTHYAVNAGTGHANCDECIEPLPQDRRFSGKEWQQWPFNLYYQSFLLQQQWWHNATTGVPGVTAQHERVLEFTARQILDVFAPSNFLLTNPEVLSQTQKEGGQNLLRGFRNLLEDIERTSGGKGPVGVENFVPGENVAVTPGKVVHRNRLIELIQYEPVTGKVRPEPILIVPAWINKYYILDLSQQNSMVKYLTEQGYSVFMISWRNPGPEDRDLGMDDYRQLGVMASLEAIQTIVPDKKVHAVGYCLGGTLLSIAAAALARNDHSPIASLSFLAAQIDFNEPGELQLFIGESQLNFLEDMMWEQGFLDAKQMAGAFQLLRSNDLIWSRNMREYLLGERAGMIDLIAWNADSTRMPYRMHSEYLRQLYLNNDFAEGRFKVDGRPVTIADISAPIFSVGTVRDHVAPWHSVYKSHLLADTEITFLLASGGHNAGIVSEPGHPHRSYQVAVTSEHDRYVDPDTWAAETPTIEGSWWPEWVAWLDKRSGKPVAPPKMGAPAKGYPPVADAPGTYVLQK